jgi:hypothetical protein
MDKLQNIFESTLQKKTGAKSLIRKIVNKKLGEEGLKLSDAQIDEIVNRLESLDEESTIRIDDIIASEDKHISDIALAINDADIKEALNEFTSALKEEYPVVVTEITGVLLEEIKRTAESEVMGFRKDRAEFEARLENRWGKPLRLLELYYLIVLEAGHEFNNHYRPTASANNDIVFDVLTRLHARACQIASEVIVLLKAGHADGAHARWRTLHEVAIVAMFIEKHGEDVAERYLHHDVVESYKGALQYRKHYAALGLQPLADKEFDKIQSAYQKALTDFGAEFKSDYGWAASALKRGRPTFSYIEEDVNLEKWRGHYKMASHNVHANPKGITFKLGLSKKDRNILFAGVSNKGLADPAHGTALSLLQITSTLLLTRSNIDTLVRTGVLMKLQREIGDEFLKVHNELESQDTLS